MPIASNTINSMRVLIVGSGAREHAIAWKLSQSPRVSDLLVAPGNAGTVQLAQNVAVTADDVDGLLQLARERDVDLTVVGPEAPLAAGIADRFDEAGLLLFGPTRAAARIETSKSFAKELMLRHGVPTGTAEIFDDFDQARGYLGTASLPVAIKADGLAAGKGVLVAESREDALSALREWMVDRHFGPAGERVLFEEYLEGQEISVFAFVDGETVSPLVAACDYKRQGDGDAGANTGGMGSYSPPSSEVWNKDVELHVRDRIMEPVAKALAAEGSPYRGILYAGLILTKDGPKVIEFNCRHGDPEAQVVLPRLITDLSEVMIRTAQGDITGMALEWDDRPCVGVVMASGGYPGAYETGYPIEGLDGLEEAVTVFHAGTKVSPDGNEEILTDGGRVLTVAALGDSLDDARSRAYDSLGRIRFHGSFFRNDIALLHQVRAAQRRSQQP